VSTSCSWCRELIDQAGIHKQTLSSNPGERVNAVRKIGVNFVVLPDKDQAWNDFSRLAEDENSNVRNWSAESISISFSYIPDKEQAWNCLLRLSGDNNENVRMDATRALGRAFPHVSEKDQAWNDLHKRTEKEADIWVRRGVTQALGYVFLHILNKEQAWNDLHRLTADHDDWVKRGAVWTLGKVFSDLPDKEMAWRDLNRLTKDDYSGVRWNAASALGMAFRHIPDQEAAWGTLIRLTKDSQEEVRWAAATSLGLAYPHVADKKLAWDDMHKLTESDDDSVRHGVAMSLGTAYPYICDNEKDLAQEDLHRLIEDVAVHVRMWATYSIGIAFPYLPDEQQGLRDLHRLLTEDDDIRVKWKAIEALGQAFPHVSDKAKVWSNLQHFASDENNMLCVFANHSLGKASIFKAAKADSEDDFKDEMEKALSFFEISAAKAWEPYNPSKFCLPFYNSFYSVTFKDGDNEAEVKRFLGQARVEIGLSESRDALLESMENLARALQSLQKSKEVSWMEKQTYLAAWRGYCDKAADLLAQAECNAPIAVEVLRRGLPIIGRRIKELLKEIEGESHRLREATRDTPFEGLGERTYSRTQQLAIIDQQVEAERILDETIQDVRIMCDFLPERSRASVCELRDWDELDLQRKASLYKRAISHCSQRMEVLSQQIVEKDAWIGYLRDEVIGRLKNINYNIFKLKISSANAADSLRALKWELDRINAIKLDIDGLGSKVEDLEVSQQQSLMELEEKIPRIIRELETLAKSRNNQLSREILEKLDDMKRSPEETIFERAANLASIVGLLIALL